MYQKQRTIDIIKEQRKYKKMTQEEVANKIGVDRKTYNRYEQGINEIKIGTIVALAELFGVTTDFLLGTNREIPRHYELTETEFKLLQAYKNNPKHQETINKILDI